MEKFSQWRFIPGCVRASTLNTKPCMTPTGWPGSFAPPAAYAVSLHEALAFALDELRDILDCDHICPQTGRPLSRIMEVKVKIYEKIEQRALGAIPQKILNLHGAAPDNAQGSETQGNRMESIQNRIEELEARDRMKDKGDNNGG